MSFSFNTKFKEKDHTSKITPQFYPTPLYTNQFEYTPKHGGYVKIPITAAKNPTIILDSLKSYSPLQLYVIPKKHVIHGVDYDAELVIEHSPATNGTDKLYACFLLKSQRNAKETDIDRLLIAASKKDELEIKLDLNSLISKGDTCILYEEKGMWSNNKYVIFTTPIGINPVLLEGITTDPELFKGEPVPNSETYKVIQIDNNNISRHMIQDHDLKEGFFEGLDAGQITGDSNMLCVPSDVSDSEDIVDVIPNSDFAKRIDEYETNRTVITFFIYFCIISVFAYGIPFFHDGLYSYLLNVLKVSVDKEANAKKYVNIIMFPIIAILISACITGIALSSAYSNYMWLNYSVMTLISVVIVSLVYFAIRSSSLFVKYSVDNTPNMNEQINAFIWVMGWMFILPKLIDFGVNNKNTDKSVWWFTAERLLKST